MQNIDQANLVALCNENKNNTVVCKLKSSWGVLDDDLRLKRYTLPLSGPIVYHTFKKLYVRFDYERDKEFKDKAWNTISKRTEIVK